MAHTKRILNVVGWNILIVFLLVTVADLVVRISIRDRTYTLFGNEDLFVGDRDFIIEHDTRGFALRPSFVGGWATIDSRGFRGDDSPECRECYRIVAMGESTTFGWNVGDEATYPRALEVGLDSGTDEPSVEVINAGVPSYTSLQTLIYIRELLPVHEPDLVLINIMWNDIWYSSVKNWFPEMLVLRRPGALRQWLLKHSGIYCALMLRADSGSEVDHFNQAALEFYAENLRAMVDECRRQGVAVAFVRPPFDISTARRGGPPILGQRYFTTPFLLKLMSAYVESSQSVAEAAGVPVIDHRLSSDHTGQSALFGDPIHPTADGNRMLAADVAAFVEENLLKK
jgi:lysophospholipase L1-like esterase